IKLTTYLLFFQIHVKIIQQNVSSLQISESKLGASVDLECYMPTFFPDTYIWIKHTPGDAPKTIVFWSNNGNVSYTTNDGSTRYQVMKSSSSLNLSITHINTSDLGTYYCGMVRGKVMMLGNGTEICLTGECFLRFHIVHKFNASDCSVNLECHMKVFSQYSYIWIKHSQGELPETIVFWSHNEGRTHKANDGSTRYQVMTSLSSFNLSITHLDTSDLGTYYCGVVKPDDILFGNGTEVCLTGEHSEALYRHITVSMTEPPVTFFDTLLLNNLWSESPHC
uniref:Ig-like domain-containing protein n=1 Tax=Erpetoichthys calabaricus TaxID=27687 RepID=A0A8C4TC76_ERPCA